jgi:ferric-dicitrate binding protein FerR (iron transport regulator)
VRSTLQGLVRDAKAELGTREAREIDWAAVDDKLFGRIQAEERRERARRATSQGSRWALVAGALAAAAALALVVGKAREPRAPESSATASDETAGRIVAIEGGGQLLVEGKPLPVGGVLRAGDSVEAHGAQITVERSGKLTWILERGTRATVTHAQGAVVVALEQGAIEAQVVPVPAGEAFAVDVGPARVAVHGTHLRIARAGDRVVVDLSEGVVSLGPAPRVGSTLGSLVTAPAHAEFSAGDAEASLTVTHDPVAVRAATPLGASAEAKPSTAPLAAVAPPRPEATEVHTGGPVPPRTDTHPGAAAAPPRPAPAPDPQWAIASAVRACLAERPRADNVTVEVSTEVRLEVDAEGNVLHARFEPPVAPDVNACASSAIYHTRFAHGGSVSIPIDFKLPASAP